MNNYGRKILTVAASCVLAGVFPAALPGLMAEVPATGDAAENFQTLRDFQSIELDAVRKPLADLDAKHRADLETLQKDRKPREIWNPRARQKKPSKP